MQYAVSLVAVFITVLNTCKNKLKCLGTQQLLSLQLSLTLVYFQILGFNMDLTLGVYFLSEFRV